MESTDQLGNADDPVFRSSSTLNNHLRDKRQNKRSKDHHGIDHSNNQSTSSLEKLINSGSYIDHRNQSDLAHLHSSPARSRRRNNGSVFKRSNLGNSDNINNHNNHNNNNNNNNNNDNNDNNNSNGNNAGSPNSVYGKIPPRRPSNLPLTNRNLQHLLRSSVSAPGAAESTTPDAVALDMDQFAREQSRLARSHSWTDPFGDGQGQGQNQSQSYGNGTGKEYGRNDSYTGNGDFDNYSVNSLEFGESNPSSDHSSDSTSLDDVWHFDREEIKRDEWPNLDILEEFVKEEYEIAERENGQGINTEQSVNFGAHHRIHDEGAGTRTGARATTEGGAAAVVGTGSYSPRLHNDRKQQQQQLSSSSPPQQQQQQNKDVGVDEDDADENTPLIENFQSNDLESLNSFRII